MAQDCENLSKKIICMVSLQKLGRETDRLLHMYMNGASAGEGQVMRPTCAFTFTCFIAVSK